MLHIKSEQECNRGQWDGLNINAQFDFENCYKLKLNGFCHITIFRNNCFVCKISGRGIRIRHHDLQGEPSWSQTRRSETCCNGVILAPDRFKTDSRRRSFCFRTNRRRVRRSPCPEVPSKRLTVLVIWVQPTLKTPKEIKLSKLFISLTLDHLPTSQGLSINDVTQLRLKSCLPLHTIESYIYY